MNIAQAILSKPHHRENAAEIFDRAEEIEKNRKAFWASEKQKLKEMEEKKCTETSD